MTLPKNGPARLIADALGGDRFATESLGRHVHHATTRPDAFGDLFGMDAFADLVATMPLRPPRIRMYRDGPLEPGRYMRIRQTRTELDHIAPDVAKIRERMAEGATLVIGTMDALVPAIAEMGRALQWWLRCPIDTTGYAVRGATEGFAPHVDDHDVVAVQLEGTKTWGLWDPTRAHPLERDVARPPRPDGEPRRVTMNAGDVLYLPRGTWHTARTPDPDGISTHLALVLRRPTGIDWIGWLADRLRASETFRADLPVFADLSAVTDHRRRLLEELVAVAERDDWSAFVDHDLATTAAPPPDDLVAVPVASAARARIVTPFAPAIRDVDGSVTVEACGKRLRFDPRCRPMLEMLATGDWVAVADLPAGGLPATAVSDTLSALDEAGMVRLARD